MKTLKYGLLHFDTSHFIDMLCMLVDSKEEVFGPVITIHSFSTDQEAVGLMGYMMTMMMIMINMILSWVELANGTSYGLAGDNIYFILFPT